MSPSRTHPTGLDEIIFLSADYSLLKNKQQGAAIRKDGNGRSSDLHPSDKRSSRKNVSDLLDACLFFPGGICAPHYGKRCLQQRDCPGFSPDSLLIAVHPHSYSGTWRLRTNCGCKGKHK